MQRPLVGGTQGVLKLQLDNVTAERADRGVREARETGRGQTLQCLIMTPWAWCCWWMDCWMDLFTLEEVGRGSPELFLQFVFLRTRL